MRDQRHKRNQLLPSFKMWPSPQDKQKDFLHHIRVFEGLVKRTKTGVVGCWRERSPNPKVRERRTESNKVPVLTPQFFMISAFVGGIVLPENVTALADSQIQRNREEIRYNDRPGNCESIVMNILDTIVSEDAPDNEENDE